MQHIFIIYYLKVPLRNQEQKTHSDERIFKVVSDGIKIQNIDTVNFNCEFCGKSFLSKINLKCHKIFHQGMKTLSCAHCEKTFLDMSSLKRHEKSYITYGNESFYGAWTK